MPLIRTNQKRPFPIQKLPLLALEIVVQNLNLVEIVDLSSLSQKTCKLLSRCRMKFNDFRDYQHEFEWNRENFQQEFAGNIVVYQIPFTFYELTDGFEGFRKEKSSDNSKRNCLLTVIYGGRKLVIDPSRIHVELLAVSMCESSVNLKNVFKSDYITLKISHMDTFSLTGPRKLDTVVVHDTCIAAPGGMVWFMSEIKMRKLCVTGMFDDLKYSGPLTAERVYLHDASWLLFNVYFHMECSTISIEKESLRADQLNIIISYWMTGKLNKLERFSMDMDVDGERGEIRKKVLLIGIRTKPWDGERRPRFFGTKDCLEAVDIRRYDGKLASVLFDYDGFNFLVWHRKYFLDH